MQSRLSLQILEYFPSQKVHCIADEWFIFECSECGMTLFLAIYNAKQCPDCRLFANQIHCPLTSKSSQVRTVVSRNKLVFLGNKSKNKLKVDLRCPAAISISSLPQMNVEKKCGQFLMCLSSKLLYWQLAICLSPWPPVKFSMRNLCTSLNIQPQILILPNAEAALAPIF